MFYQLIHQINNVKKSVERKKNKTLDALFILTYTLHFSYVTTVYPLHFLFILYLQ